MTPLKTLVLKTAPAAVSAFLLGLPGYAANATDPAPAASEVQSVETPVSAPEDPQPEPQKGADPAPPHMLCSGFGPQSPRDIRDFSGENLMRFAMAPPAAAMNLCNIHVHGTAEHKGPGFSRPAPDGSTGYQCNETRDLTIEEQIDLTAGHGAFKGVHPGSTIEVHWVYTSCDVAPGPGLDACLSATCANPTLRVETQVFLVVNDDTALNFDDFAYSGHMANGLHQPRALPTGTGDPVLYRGSTTGPTYSHTSCSPLQVTWNVRPVCAKLSFASLNAWAANGNVFAEDHAHGARPLVTAPALLAPIQH